MLNECGQLVVAIKGVYYYPRKLAKRHRNTADEEFRSAVTLQVSMESAGAWSDDSSRHSAEVTSENRF